MRTYEDYQDLAKKKGYEIITSAMEFSNQSPVTFRCSKGHIFTYDREKENRKPEISCPVCDVPKPEKSKKPDPVVQKLAQYDVSLVSRKETPYKDELITIKCPHDHESTYLRQVFLRHFKGCPWCRDIEAASMLAIAQAKGLELLMINIINISVKQIMIFRCSHGHHIRISLERMAENGYTCYQCTLPNIDNPLQRMITRHNLTLNFAITQKLYLTCSNNHHFTMRPYALDRFNGCRECKRPKSR